MPPHLWCASHNLSLIATTDFENAIKGNVVYKLSYKRVIAKMKALWNKTSRSVQASDDMYEILVRYLPRPGKTRWNSLFDSVRTLAEQDPKKINDLLTQLKIPNVTNTDQIFISEFLSLMSPIAISWNALQGEKKFFLGCVLPLLIRLKEKLSSLKLSNSGGKLRDVLISKIDQRFGCDDHIVAAVTHPKFKLHWISDSEEKQSVIRKIEKIIGQAHSTPASTPMSKEDFLCFDKAVNNESELHRYLNDKCKDISMLSKYPSIRSIFVRYNTALPSSGPVKRLFSTAALVFTARRARLSDVLLQHLILLKIFRNLWLLVLSIFHLSLSLYLYLYLSLYMSLLS